jgi:hypothetical protein
VVLYGGATNEGRFLDDLWSWDGSRWTLRGRSVPSAGHLLYSDENRNLILAGGTAGITARWEDASWVTMVREPDRVLMAGAYDAARARFVMHGGSGGPREAVGETLEFDGASWMRVTTNGPSARIGGAMAFDDARDVAVLFGGAAFDPLRRLGDLWEWDGVTWRQPELTSPRPAARVTSGMAFDPRRREIVLFGGLDDASLPLADTWLWNGSSWRLAEVEGPSARDEPYMAFDHARGVVVLFGGSGATALLADTWEWDGSRWARRDVP